MHLHTFVPYHWCYQKINILLQEINILRSQATSKPFYVSKTVHFPGGKSMSSVSNAFTHSSFPTTLRCQTSMLNKIMGSRLQAPDGAHGASAKYCIELVIHPS